MQYGNTPLHLVVKRCNRERLIASIFLLRMGANPNALNKVNF